MTNTYRFFNPEMPLPVVLDEVRQYSMEPGLPSEQQWFGYFPGLHEQFPDIAHGFQWDGPGGLAGRNIFVRREPEAPNREEVVRERIVRCLGALGMGDPAEAVMMVSPPGEQRVVFMTPELLDESELTPRGRLIECGAIFAPAEMHLPIYTGPADCTMVLVIAPRPEKSPLVGFMHVSRLEAATRFPDKVIHALEEQGCPVGQIWAGVLPNLEPDRHSVQPDDLQQLLLQNVQDWSGHIYRSTESGMYHLDVGAYAVSMMVNAGIDPKHIEFYTVGSYQAAAEGYYGSHRYSTSHKLDVNPRIFFGAQPK